MLDATYAFLSLEYSGLIIAIAILGVAFAVVARAQSNSIKWLGRLIGLTGVVLAVGAISHLVRVSQIDENIPPPGTMVDLGGYKVHVLAEGPDDGPTIVWFAGGYIGGLGHYADHVALRDEVRSILIDRPGTGWSEAGPFPRTTAVQAEEMMAVLDELGESGPFIFAGHSFGGLLAANIARRYPDRTAAVVLMDATPLDVIVYGLDKTTLRSFSTIGLRHSLRLIFGLYRSPLPLDADGNVDVALSQPMRVRAYVENRARMGVASASAFEELTPEGLDDRAFETMLFAGELGDMPLYLIAPGKDASTALYAQMVAENAEEGDRFVRFLQATRERYLDMSNNSTRIYAPEGTGHNFIYERPDFLPEAMRRIVAEVNAASAARAGDYAQLTTQWPGPFGGLPPVELATPDKLWSAYQRAAAEKRDEMASIGVNIEPATFENTILAFESSGLALERLDKLFGIFATTTDTPGIREIAPKVAALRQEIDDEILFDRRLFERVQAVHSALPMSAPSNEAIRLTNVIHDRFVRGGAALSEGQQAELKAINARLAELRTRFAQNVMADERSLGVIVRDRQRLDGLTDTQIGAARSLAEARGINGAWVIAINRPSVWPVLTNVHSRSLREEVWRTWVTRGGNEGPNNNAPVVNEILKLRGEKARIYGYPTFAHWQTEARMAGTPDTAMDLMLQTWELLREPTRKEIEDLQAIADAEGADFELQPWDRLYYAEKYRQQNFNLDADDIKPYMALQNVVDAMFWTAGEVYGFEFQALPDVATVSPDIDVYAVSRDGEDIGVLWVDLFSRPGKSPSSYAGEYRTQETFRGKVLPLVALHSAVTPPTGDEPVLVDWERANVIFHEFGHTLQTLSNTASYPSLGALRAPWDFIEVPALLHERWFMDETVFKQFARHHETGEPIPDELYDRIIAARKYDRVFGASYNYIGAAIVDMRLHLLADGRDIDAMAVERQVLDEVGLPEAYDLVLHVPHAFHTFTAQYAAGVYTYLWSDVIAADIAEAFLESPDSLYDKETAQRYRELILEPGNAVDVADAFREFRGREPDPAAFMRRFDLLD